MAQIVVGQADSGSCCCAIVCRARRWGPQCRLDAARRMTTASVVGKKSIPHARKWRANARTAVRVWCIYYYYINIIIIIIIITSSCVIWRAVILYCFVFHKQFIFFRRFYNVLACRCE